MSRLGTLFVTLCMVLIAGSVGAVLFLYLRLGAGESAIAAGAVLVLLAFYNALGRRAPARRDVGDQIADLARGTADLAHQVTELGRRVAALDGKIEGSVETARAAVSPVASELGELGALVQELAEALAAHDMLLSNGRLSAARVEGLSERPESQLLAATPAPAAAAQNSAAQIGTAPPVTAHLSFAATSAAAPNGAAAAEAEAADHADLLALIRTAVEANRIDLYLQPIVTLPQRKVRYYEAMSRLRGEDGTLIAAVDFLPHAEAAGLMPPIDNLLLFRCVQVLRRLLLKNRDIGMFCNISATTLADSAVFPQLLEFMEANRALAPSLTFEFTQSAVRAMGPIETESLAALASRGFRFSMDNVTDLRVDLRGLADRGFRFIKAPAKLLLNRQADMVAADIHPADLAGLLQRFGIDLVAEKIESETAVVDLLDQDVRFGQGFLFSPPRPVRPEALQGVADRQDVVAIEPGSGGRTPEAARAATEPGKRPPAEQNARGLARLARPVFADPR